MRRADVSDPRKLADKARQLATDIEPWADRVLCSVRDYGASGLGGDYARLTIPKPLTGSAADLFGPQPHPLSREYYELLASEARASTHVVDLVPSDEVPAGQIVCF